MSEFDRHTNARMVFGCHEGRNEFFAKNARMIFVFIRVFVANFFATNTIRILFVYSWLIFLPLMQ